MPTNYDGVAGNVSTASAINISSSTDSNPITITVTGTLPADFLTGVTVSISNHQINVAANGIWAATPTGASTFTIPTSGSGAGPGAATGKVQPLNLNSLYTYPSDGDADNQASISSWAHVTGDRTQWLASRTGAYKLANVYSLRNIDDTYAAFATITTTSGWQLFSPVGGTVLPFIPVQIGDILETEYRTTVQLQASSFSAALDIRVAQYQPSSSPVLVYGHGGADFEIAGTTGYIVTMPLILRAFTFLTGTGPDTNVNGFVNYNVACLGTINPGFTVQLRGSYYWISKLWRPTGLGQGP